MSDSAKRREVAELFGGDRLVLLAEKVESHQDVQEAMELGYGYLQGYFFCKPEIVSGKDVPAYKYNYLRFLQEVNAAEINYDRLEETIKREVSLSTKLLRYMASAAMGVRHRLTSIKQALALLGERPLRKWASVVALGALAQNKPAELLVSCLVRARFEELLCPLIGLQGRGLDMFMMGLFSGLDAAMDKPLESLASQIPVPQDVLAALLGANTILGRAHRLTLAFETGNATIIDAMARSLKIDPGAASELYCQAVQWADRSFAAQ
jgi:EAL and modified HD-GYP domain-containing signal transduction protein